LISVSFNRDKSCVVLQDRFNLYKYDLPEFKTIYSMKGARVMIPYSMPDPNNSSRIVKKFFVGFEDKTIDIVDPSNWQRQKFRSAKDINDDIKLMKYDEDNKLLFFMTSSVSMYNMVTKA